MNQLQNFTKGFIKESPTFVLMLGMCPTLGVTTSAVNGLGMGLATTAVLVLSNIIISCIKSLIPDKVRIPAFIVIIASLVTVVQMCMEAYLPSLYASLGLFIPLIVVNCLILGRAEAFASKHGVWSSFVDGAGMGLGFTFGLTVLGMVRELLGNYAVFGHKLVQGDGILVFVLAPGAFLALGVIVAFINAIRKKA